MADFITTEWLTKYSFADAREKTRLAGQMLQNFFVWLEQTGPAALQQEEQIVQQLTSVRMPSNIITAVRFAFANLRMVMQAAQAAHRNLPPMTLWRAMIDIFRQIAGSMAGGMQNIGNWIMNGGRYIGQTSVAAIGAIVAMGRIALTEAYTAIIGAITATIGMEVFIGALVVIGLVMLLSYIAEKNRKPFEIEDPLLKRASERGVMMPHPFYGNAH